MSISTHNPGTLTFKIGRGTWKSCEIGEQQGGEAEIARWVFSAQVPRGAQARLSMGPRVRRSVKGSGAGDHKLRKGARKQNRYLLNSDGRGRKSHSEKKGVL